MRLLVHIGCTPAKTYVSLGGMNRGLYLGTLGTTKCKQMTQQMEQNEPKKVCNASCMLQNVSTYEKIICCNIAMVCFRGSGPQSGSVFGQKKGSASIDSGADVENKFGMPPRWFGTYA